VTVAFQERVRRSIIKSLAASPLPALMASRCSGIGSILTFHRICTTGSGALPAARSVSVTPEAFRCVILELRQKGFDFVSMSEVASRTQSADPCGKFVCLTIDDGYGDTFHGAFPICREMGVPLTVYVATGPMKRRFPMWWLGLEQLVAAQEAIEFRWDNATKLLPAQTPAQKHRAYLTLAHIFSNTTASQALTLCEAFEARYPVSFMAITDRHAITAAMIDAMSRSGLVEFGGHTVTHSNLRVLDADDAHDEIAASCADVEEIIGRPVQHFAYPYGKAHAAGPREFDLCRLLGLSTAVTTRMDTLGGFGRNDLHALPRLSMPGDYDALDLLEVLVSGALPALVRASRLVARAQ
jgi:peptidoglycan/xylan/chitin deacetylase (PgdA/CDA1 family)